jgi:hypothetical protein
VHYDAIARAVDKGTETRATVIPGAIFSFIYLKISPDIDD